MTWFKVDDGSAFNAKVMAAGNEAWGAFCRVGAWCAQQLTDGRFSRAIAVTIAPMRVWDRLIDVGLVDPLENGEMEMHDYLQRNPSKEEVLRDRASSKARVYALRNAKRNGVTPTISNEPCNGLPVPSRPVPVQDPTGSCGPPARPPKRASALPEDWSPTETDTAFARKRGWSAEKVSEEALRFESHHRAKGSVMKDWAAAWRTWVLNAHRFAAPPRAPMQSGRFRSSPPAAPTMTYKEFKSDPPPPMVDGAKQAEMAASIARIGRGGT
jgi:hypothetical protein